MPAFLGDWVGYTSVEDQHDPITGRKRARRLISPDSGDAFFVQGEYDDGNGMWVITGVSL